MHDATALTLAAAISGHATNTPDHEAILAPDRRRLTYRNLSAQIQLVGSRLNSIGIGRNDRVAIVLPNGPELAAAFVSVACCATAAPLNPAYRANEFDFYLSDLNAKALIVQDTIDSPAIVAAQRHSIPVIESSAVAENGGVIFNFRGQGKPCELNYGFAEPEDTALVLYTSGTTAKPKKVPLTHANLLVSAANIAATLELTDKDRCLNVMPLFHIHGLVGALLSSLFAGASAVCTPGFNPERFFTWLEEFAPTWYTAVPTMHQAILSNSKATTIPSSLRFIRSSSASLPPKVTAELEKLFHVPVIEAYGMTEAAHQIASNRPPPARRKAGSVGAAVGTDIAVIDEQGRALPTGQSGEIVLRGTNLMRGYEGGGNEETFLDGWFRTGDRGYLDADEYLFLTGRLKEQINRGGEKVSPYEVEAVFLEHPAVEQAVVFALRHPTLGEEVAAAVVAKDSRSVSEGEMRRYAAVRLAEFKVPSRVMVVEEIPKGPTGKVQRIGLGERLGLEGESRRTEYVAPRDGIERELARIWTEVLGVDRIGVHDNFFDLGGQSIVAAQIINRVRTAMKTELSPVSFFETPTIADQAQLVRQIGPEDVCRPSEVEPLRSIAEPARENEFPLSATQRRLWLYQQLHPESIVAARPVAFLLRGDLNRQALERSFNEIVRRHEILRTIYRERNGEPFQMVLPLQPVSVESRDLQSLSEEAWDAEVQRISLEEARNLTDLAQRPPFKPLLLRRDRREQLLLILTNHIAFDGWSEALLIHELVTLYEAFVEDRPSPLPELPLQYRDFAARQLRQFGRDGSGNGIEYWKKQLHGIAPTLLLPRTPIGLNVLPFERSRHSFVLPSDLAETLGSLSRRENATPFMVFLAAFQILLNRYSRQDDIAVGTIVAGRAQSEIEDLIGCFANLLVLRADLSVDATFRDFLQRVRMTALEAYEYQDLPFEALVESLAPERSLRQTPLFEVLIELRNMPQVRRIAAGGLNLERFPLDFGLGTWALILQLSETNDGFHGTFEFATELFPPEMIERMAGHYQTLLRSIATNPDQKVSTIPMLTEEEKRDLLVNQNRSRVNYRQEALLHTLFAEKADAAPDHTAVIFGDQQLTYRELNERANQLAHYLRKRGVGPDGLVAVYMERSLEMVVALLGILKAGGAYVPLDPAYPRERVVFMLEDTRAPVLVTQQRWVEDLSGHAVQVVCLDRDRQEIAEQSRENPHSGSVPENLAYVIYTSGSTGKPKGVLITHYNVIRLLESTWSRFQFDQTDVWTMFHSYAFDFSVWEMWGALLYGGRLVVVPYWLSRSPDTFYKLLSQQKVTVLNQTPSAFRQLIQVGESFTRSHQLALRLVVFGGEALDFRTLGAWFDRHGDQRPRLINMYGITETTVHVTYRAITAADLSPRKGSMIGVPLPDLDLYVLDQQHNPVPMGVSGELYVGGAGVARGYLNRPELTAERFIPNPFRPGTPERLYRSGDLVRYLSNRDIEYLGRIDDQVKVRGFRIELGEIEAILAQHAAVQQAVVVAREDSLGDKRLVAYVVSNQRGALAASDLRDFLKTKVPDHMLPSTFMFLDEFPLTSNGKLDRRALPAPDSRRPDMSAPFQPPRTPAERQLAGIWRELLRRDQLGIHDNFFDLGGHSLLLMQLAARISDAFQVRVPLRAMFDLPTIEKMSQAILDRRVKNTDPAKVEDMLAKVAQLSSDEVLRLLNNK